MDKKDWCTGWWDRYLGIDISPCFFESSKDIAESMLEKKIKEIKISEAETYLSNTDWYYSRLAETGKEVPEDVVAKRLEARALINELEEG